MPLPRLGDMPSEKITEGSKIHRASPSPYFEDREKQPVPEDLRWFGGLIDEFYLKLRKTVLHTSLPYWQYPPFDHEDIDVKTTSAALVAGATVTLVTIAVPQHQVAVIRLYGQDIEAVVPPTLVTAWNDIAWTFKVGKFPLQYFDGFVGQRGSLLNLRPTAITIKGPDTFTVDVTNSGAVSYYVTLSLIGHQYSILSTPISLEDSLKL